MKAQPQDRERTLLERLTFFSDAVFAIAITLLVIEIHPPVLHGANDAALVQALLDLIPNYIGFVVSFFVIGRFWLGHHRLFGMLARSDDRLIVANLQLLFGIAFMPFPTAVFSDHSSLPSATLLYTGWLVVVGLLNFRLIRVALSGERYLDAGSDGDARALLLRGSWLPILLGLVASGAVFVHPLLPVAVLILGPLIWSILWRLFRGRK